MNHAAFGTGFYKYRDWETRDGEMWDFYIKGSGFQGDISASRPPGGAVWEGRMVRYQSGLEEDPFVPGNARVRLSFARDRVSVGFSRVTSTDLERSLERFGFDDGPVKGAFFGA